MHGRAKSFARRAVAVTFPAVDTVPAIL